MPRKRDDAPGAAAAAARRKPGKRPDAKRGVAPRAPGSGPARSGFAVAAVAATPADSKPLAELLANLLEGGPFSVIVLPSSTTSGPWPGASAPAFLRIAV